MMFYRLESASISCNGLRGAHSLSNVRMDDQAWCHWWIWDRRVAFERGMRMEMLGRIWKCGRDGLMHSIRRACNVFALSQYMAPVWILLLDTIWIIMMYTYIYIYLYRHLFIYLCIVHSISYPVIKQGVRKTAFETPHCLTRRGFDMNSLNKTGIQLCTGNGSQPPAFATTQENNNGKIKARHDDKKKRLWCSFRFLIQQETWCEEGIYQGWKKEEKKRYMYKKKRSHLVVEERNCATVRIS